MFKQPYLRSVILFCLMLVLPACANNATVGTAADVAALTVFISTVEDDLAGASSATELFDTDEASKFKMVVQQLKDKRARYKALADDPVALLASINNVDAEYWQLYTAYFTLRTLAVDHWPDYPEPVQQQLIALNRKALAANTAYHNLKERISNGGADINQLNSILQTASTVAQMAAVMH